jgi:hypothetical protein
MVDGLMALKLCAHFVVVAGVIRHQAAFAADVRSQDRRDIRNGRAVDMEAAGRAAALDKR